MKRKIACLLGIFLSCSALAAEEYKVSTGDGDKIPFVSSEVSLEEEKAFIAEQSNDFAAYIFGGQTADPEDHKFFARIIVDYGYSYQNICGASILDDRHILTAAHCVAEDELGITEDYRMRVVVRNPMMGIQRSELKEIESIQIHEDYGTLMFYFGDVAVVKLKYPITDNVQSITLPDATHVSEYATVGNTLRAFGLGDTGFGAQPSQVKEAELEYILDAECANFGNDSNIFCAKLHSSSLISGDTCQGDSGGPITYLKDGIYQQIGLTSYGPSNCRVGSAAAYTDIEFYRDWILSYMYGGTPLNYNSATDDGGYVSNGDGANYRDWYTGDTGSNGDSGDSGGSTGLLTLLGLGLLTLRRKK